MALLRHSPSGLSASCRSSGLANDSMRGVMCEASIHLNAGSACRHVVRLTSWHATSIQNGLWCSRSWNSLPSGGSTQPAIIVIFVRLRSWS